MFGSLLSPNYPFDQDMRTGELIVNSNFEKSTPSIFIRKPTAKSACTSLDEDVDIALVDFRDTTDDEMVLSVFCTEHVAFPCSFVMVNSLGLVFRKCLFAISMISL